jgi:DNA polymerase-3 subunit epsilon
VLPSITFVDLETTGATPSKDRITEIALVRFDQGIETARWQTLVNPEQSIPPFIQKLTGIDDDMVASAPKFADIANTLLGFLEGTVLSAHNVRFDHGFIKTEFKRLEIIISPKVLCTVKLSRLLYPAFHSHGLDAILKRHNLTTHARHRAMGDVETVLAFLAVAEMELGKSAIEKAAQQLMRGPTLPPHLDSLALDEMPDTPGVYLFYGENDLPLYIGKSIKIRTRVLSHFSREHASAKEMRLNQAVKRVEWIDTAGELSALLIEANLVKEKQPLYNRPLRAERQLCSWYLNPNKVEQPLLNLVSMDAIMPIHFSDLYGIYKSKRHAVEALRKIIDLHHLCPQSVGLEQGEGPCFAFQLKRCKGVCAGHEKPEIYYLRLKKALIKHQINPWPFKGKVAIREHNNENGLIQFHVFSNWTYQGYADDEASLDALVQQKPAYQFDLDTYQLLNKIFNTRKVEIIDLSKSVLT